jgi:flagellar hook-length control protein FliK
MDVALQAYQLETDSTNKCDKKKTYSAPSDKRFGEHLENIRDIIEKPLICDKSKKTDILLMHLIYLLNMNISAPDFEKIVGHQLSDVNTNSVNLDFAIEPSSDELTRCWQKILSELDINGSINQDNVKMFYLAIKKAVPDIPDVDLKALYNQINKILASSHSEDGESEDSKIPNNGFTREHSLTTVKTEVNNGIERDDRKKPDIHNLKHSRKDDYNTDLVRNVNKNVSGKHHVSYNELQDHWIINVTDNISRTLYGDVSPFSLKESFVAPLDKIDSNIITFSPDTSEVFEQLVDRMHLAFKGDVQQVSVRLKPDHLGDVIIKVIADKDELKAELYVDNTQVRTMLKVHTLDFQNQIREQGYNISEISIYKMSDGLEMGAFNHQSSGSNHQQGRRPRAGLNKQDNEYSKIGIEDYYDYWGNASKVNYMA